MFVLWAAGLGRYSARACVALALPHIAGTGAAAANATLEAAAVERAAATAASAALQRDAALAHWQVRRGVARVSACVLSIHLHALCCGLRMIEICVLKFRFK